MNPDTQTKIDNATTNLVTQTIASIKRHATIAFTPPQIPPDLPWYCHPIFWVFSALTMTVMAVAMLGAYLIAMFFRGAYLAVVLMGAAIKRKKAPKAETPSVVNGEHVADRAGLVVDAEESTAGPVHEQGAADTKAWPEEARPVVGGLANSELAQFIGAGDVPGEHSKTETGRIPLRIHAVSGNLDADPGKSPVFPDDTTKWVKQVD